MSKLSPVPSESDQQVLGQQIQAQYERATTGLVENVALGGLIERAQEAILSTRGQVATGGSGAKDTGLEGWLKLYAPAVTRGTAYRCLDLAEGVREEMAIGKKVDLYDVLKGSAPSDREAALREKITAFVAGKSQRTLLIGFGKIDGERGGKRTTTKKATPEEIRAAYLEDAKQRSLSVFSGLHELDDRWQVLDDDQLRLAVEDSEKFIKRARKYLEVPKARRPEFNVEKYQEERS